MCTSVVWLLCRCGVPGLWTKVGTWVEGHHHTLRTGCDDFAKDVGAVNDGAVPATVPELVLALVDGQLSSVTNSHHVLGVAPADPPLPPRQPSQSAALGVRGSSDVVRRYSVEREMANASTWYWLSIWRRQRRQRPTAKMKYSSALPWKSVTPLQEYTTLSAGVSEWIEFYARFDTYM